VEDVDGLGVAHLVPYHLIVTLLKDVDTEV